MTHAHQRISAQRRGDHVTRLLSVIRDLKKLEADLLRDGLSAEAASAATVKADLEWQCEELAVKTQMRCSA